MRIARGHDDSRSEDVVFVPKPYNYLGSSEVVSHSGPYDYLQRVPLVMFGPGWIRAAGSVERAVTVADVYPTVERLSGVDLDPRRGYLLDEALRPPLDDPPRLVVFVMWDGVGRNVLERWPSSWPNLAALERAGTSYSEATVGSSPSITPSTHATLGTGAFPEEHGITGIQHRDDAGEVTKAFHGQDPSDLQLSTFADQVDAAHANQSKVGLMGLRIWHLPMLGHGAALEGGDRDEVAIIGAAGRVAANPRFYSEPPTLQASDGPGAEIARLDAEDGELDEEWLGHDIAADQDNPAWVRYQHRLMIQMLEQGRYGEDAVPDLFFVNVKMTDIVGHKYSMDSPEMEQVLRAQDRSLGGLIAYLEESVGDFVIFVSADHGHTPPPQVSGGWPIRQSELEADLDRAFVLPIDETLTQATTAVGPFLDHQVMEAQGIDAWDVAGFLHRYTIADNWSGDLPAGYAERRNERVFDAVFPSSEIDEALACARDA